MQKINVGIIGAGFIGIAHIEALRRLGFVDVIALADTNIDAISIKREQLAGIKFYRDYRELIRDSRVQAVHICTPNHLHYIMAKEALLAGKHIICEKPLTIDSHQALELIKIAEENKLVNAIHYNLRFYPLIHHAKDIIKKGQLGRILAVNGSYQQDWLMYDTDYNWRLEPEFSGISRAVADIGSHWMDIVEFVTGINIVKLCADFAIFHPVRKKPENPINTYSTNNGSSSVKYQEVEINTEDYASVLFRFDNGAHGSMTVNQVAAGKKNQLRFQIFGSRSSIEWNSETPNQMWIGRRDGNNEIVMKDPLLLHEFARKIVSFPGGHNEGFPDTSKQMFNKVYRYILNRSYLTGEAPNFPTFKAGYRDLILCERIVKSAKEGKWVKV